MLVNKNYGNLVVKVADFLSSQYGGEISKYDLEGEPGAHRVAYSLVEICESAEKIVSIMSRLRQVSDDEKKTEVYDPIALLRDEIEHFVYHVKDSGVFSDIMVSDED